MYSLNLKEFWEKDVLAHKENCFSSGSPQVAFGIRMSDECLFAELGEEGNPWGITEPTRLYDMRKRYNDKAEKIVGKRLLNENPLPPADAIFPAFRQIGEVFSGKYVFKGSWWLESDITTENQLEKALDNAERILDSDFRNFVLPENWDAKKKEISEKYGIKPRHFNHIRGPVTLAMSIYGVENLIYLIMDESELAARFSQLITRTVKAYIDLFDAEAGYTRETRKRGFSFADDNCCMLNADMYDFFAAPILKEIFEYAAPKEGDNRFQHSDSPMAHILPILAGFNLTGCNFGPTVMIDEIRKYMPKTRIDGQLAPFTFMSNDEEKIISEVKRDCEFAKQYGRGVNISTAGSINNGSLLTSMRAVMYAIDKYGQY